MRSVGLITALVLVGSVGGAAPRAAALAAETCAAPFRVAQKSFQRLDARNAYVWVDDIESKIRGYAPFQMTVVVGNAYPPFRAESGRLEREAFERLMKGAYGVTRTNGTVSEAAVKSGSAAVSFTSAKESRVLRVVSVNTSAGGEDAVMLKLCR